MKLRRKETRDITIVMPCLNELQSVGYCVRTALDFIKRRSLKGEVIVVDNGSTDGSTGEAIFSGAIVLKEKVKGYGAAIRKGLRYSSGRVVIIGDCDTTYDFSKLDYLYDMIDRGNCDMVIGNRFAGGIEKGAMPVSHNIGVRVLSKIGRISFKSEVYDFHCGLRSISRKALEKAEYKTVGMEFATEMIAEAERKGFVIGEVPVKLSISKYERTSKLKAVKDGMRHLGYIVHKGRI